jgi:ferredoxin-type protein NapH
LAGRAFCAWICPVPPLTRFFRPSKGGAHDVPAAVKDVGAAPEASKSSSVTAPGGALPAVGGQRDGRRIDSRHAVLLGALISTAVFGFPVFCLICPVGLVFATFIALWRMFVEQDPTWSLLVFPLVLFLELVLFRKWCHRLCPLGALMSLLTCKSPLLHPQLDEDTCLRTKGVDCRICVEQCPEKLDPHTPKIPECTKCGICAERCPTRAISLRLLGR